MKRPEPDSPAARRRSDIAAEWLAKRDRGLTAAEQDEFLSWLAADPRHGEWFALHRHAVQDFTALAQWRPADSAEPNPDLLARPRSRVVWWLVPSAVTMTAAAAIAVGFFWIRRAEPLLPQAQVAMAVRGPVEFERRILEDGSTIDLNQGAVVTTQFTAAERRVALVRGEASFTVAKNPGRPFVVEAQGVTVRAVGTAFNVRLDRAAVEVLVTEGKVQVHGAQPASASARATAGESARAETGRTPAEGSASAQTQPAASFVSAGQRATVPLAAQAAAPQVVAVSEAEAARLLGWQPKVLDFSSTPLKLAVAEFNRRNRVQFVITDESLDTIPIVGAIRSDNVHGFERFLAATPGVAVERRGELEIVLRRQP